MFIVNFMYVASCVALALYYIILHYKSVIDTTDIIMAKMSVETSDWAAKTSHILFISCKLQLICFTSLIISKQN